MLRSLKLMKYAPQDKAHQHTHDLKKWYKEINYKLSPNPTTVEAAYALILTREAELTHPWCTVHISDWLITMACLFHNISTAELYTYAGCFPTCDIIGISV